MTRAEAVRALLSSLFDYLPGPPTARYGDVPGPAPSTTRQCTRCSGTGHYGKRKAQCKVCDGTGKVATDAYTGEQVALAGQRVRSADSRRIEAELRRLAKEEATRRGRLLDDPFAWEAARIRYRRAGDYAALERALEALRANLPEDYSLVMARLVYRTVPENGQEPRLEAAVAWLAAKMPPGVIRVPPWVASPPEPQGRAWTNGPHRSPAREQRNASIAQLAAQGLRQAEIAAQVGVSAATVSRVLGGTVSASGGA